MIFNPILILGTRGTAYGWVTKPKPYNMSLISKYKMQENVCKLTYPSLKYCLKALHIKIVKCHALVIGYRTENQNRKLVIIGYR